MDAKPALGPMYAMTMSSFIDSLLLNCGCSKALSL